MLFVNVNLILYMLKLSKFGNKMFNISILKICLNGEEMEVGFFPSVF